MIKIKSKNYAALIIYVNLCVIIRPSSQKTFINSFVA